MDYSIVCPFYNEAKIIERASLSLIHRLRELPGEWELLLVNDGSTDDSLANVERVAATEPRLRILSYPGNRGRGFALRTGLAAARGDIIVTTEMDLSWGSDIVHRLIEAMKALPQIDLVVASPHLSGGGYKNVPKKRILLSRFGNFVIRRLMPGAVSMNTGMTRAYRRQVIQSLPLSEDHKEFHVEVILKATALGLQIHEIPAVLDWQGLKQDGEPVARKSSSRVKRLVISHTMFSLFANPVRYVLVLSFAAIILGGMALVLAVVLLALNMTSVYLALMSVILVILGVLLFVLAVVLQQGQFIQREIWSLQRSFHLPSDTPGSGRQPLHSETTRRSAAER